jgi:crotonobetainyl-CoA:carnitine CoA-transferase CaiB-like acyl-CoA transferase
MVTDDADGLGILVGIRVIDVSHHMAGPFATQKLGDMGADVIKIEPPTGEWSRSRAINNIWLGDLNTSFLSLNRNKRGATLNLKSDQGRKLLYQLVEEADVFVANFRPAAALRLGVDYDALRRVNERLVYCSITGYGENGPIANRPGQDLLAQAYSGMVWNAGRETDPPIAAGALVADATTSYMAVIGILGALLERERSGRGQKVEVNLLSSALDVQVQEFTTFLNSGYVGRRSAEWLAHPNGASPYGIHRTRDGWIAVGMGSYAAFADALNAPELRQFTSWNDGFSHRDQIFRMVAERLALRTTGEWIEVFDRHGLWAGPVKGYPELDDDGQVAANGMIWELDDPEKGHLRFVGFPIRFSRSAASVRLAPPRLGEHTEEILAEIGIEPGQIVNLRDTGVL